VSAAPLGPTRYLCILILASGLKCAHLKDHPPGGFGQRWPRNYRSTARGDGATYPRKLTYWKRKACGEGGDSFPRRHIRACVRTLTRLLRNFRAPRASNGRYPRYPRTVFVFITMSRGDSHFLSPQSAGMGARIRLMQTCAENVATAKYTGAHGAAVELDRFRMAGLRRTGRRVAARFRERRIPRRMAPARSFLRGGDKPSTWICKRCGVSGGLSMRQGCPNFYQTACADSPASIIRLRPPEAAIS
jgi:hypothetical protein